MVFEKKIKINGMDLDKFEANGCCAGIGTDGKVPVIECEGKQYTSFFDLVKNEEGYSSFYSGSTGCEYWVHYWSMLVTDTVKTFCDDYKCEWLLDVIMSYFMYVSSVIVKSNEKTGKVEFVENPRGVDDFLVVHLQKVSDSSAVFTIEKEEYDEKLQDSVNRSIVLQYIPYTDIEIDSIEFYIENGVVLFPEEH